MLKEIKEWLEKEFDKKDYKLNSTGFVYVEVDKYIKRLNEIFDNSWSFEILTPIEKAYVEFSDSIVVNCRVTVPNIVDKNDDGSFIANGNISKDGFGSSPVARFKSNPKNPNPNRDNKPVDIGNNYKSSSSDALKVACRMLGLGLHMYDKEWHSENKEGDEVDGPEKVDKKPEEIKPIQPQQRKAIEIIANAKKVDLQEFLKSNKVESLDKLNETEAGKLIVILNSIKAK